MIIVSDAECDPDAAFGGLGTLIRMCEVDFGCMIDVDVDALRQGTADRDWSTSALRRRDITYPRHSRGHLIYLKASMTGTKTGPCGSKGRAIRSSRTSQPATSSGEDQFESYRQLGQDIARKAFEEPSVALRQRGRVDDRARRHARMTLAPASPTPTASRPTPSS